MLFCFWFFEMNDIPNYPTSATSTTRPIDKVQEDPNCSLCPSSSSPHLIFKSIFNCCFSSSVNGEYTTCQGRRGAVKLMYILRKNTKLEKKRWPTGETQTDTVTFWKRDWETVRQTMRLRAKNGNISLRRGWHFSSFYSLLLNFPHLNLGCHKVYCEALLCCHLHIDIICLVYLFHR